MFFRSCLTVEPNVLSSFCLPMQWRKEPASHAEHGTWDLLVVRVLSEWMRDDAFFEGFVGRAVLILSVKFAETGCRDSATTVAVVGSTVLRTPRGEWKYCGNSAPDGPYWRLSLNSLNMSVRLQFAFRETQFAREPTSEMLRLEFGSLGSRAGRWSDGKCCRCNGGLFSQPGARRTCDLNVCESDGARS